MKKFLILFFMTLLFGCQQLPVSLPSNGNGSAQKAWTGFLEGETVDVSPLAGGRLAHLAVAEGDTVQEGQLLFSQDDELIRRRIDIADANVAAAAAQVKLLEAGSRPEDIAQAQAQVDQASASVDAAAQGVKDAEAIRANPQELVIARAQADLNAQAAAKALEAAIAGAQAADLQANLWGDTVKQMWNGADVTLPNGTVQHFDTPSQQRQYAQDQWNQASHQAWQAWAGVDAAKANKQSADAALQDIQDQLANPIALDTGVDQAKAKQNAAAAGLQAAQAGLQSLRDGASTAQLDAARSALEQANAAHKGLDKDLADAQVKAPRSGTVARGFYREGEVVPSAAPVVELSVVGDLTLRVFVPMSELQGIRIGQQLTIWLPDAGNRTAQAQVSHIADQAEFTGRQPQTDSERNAQLVAVEIKLSQPDAAIKAGMPASVSFRGDEVAAAMLTPVAAPALDVPAGSGLTFSGTLEERQTRVAPELSGQISTLKVSRGDEVKAGDTLVELNDADLKSSLDEANAGVRAAQANLDQVQEPARPGALALADAKVAQAQADLDSAQRAADDAARALADPQDVTMQVHAWEGKMSTAQASVTLAEATSSDLQRQIDQAGLDQSMQGKDKVGILQKQMEAAQANRAAAQIQVDQSGKILDLYRALASNPLQLAAARNGAASAVKVAEAGLAVAQAGRDIVKRGPQPDAVALAQARLQAATANAALVAAQLKRTTIPSPIAGRVVDRQGQVGETAKPGSALVTLADPRQLELTVYIPVAQMGSIHAGQAAVVRLPSIPGKTFDGAVTYIASESEFKPANIYNSQDRSEMVFAVRLTVANPNDELKAGLPADVTLR